MQDFYFWTDKKHGNRPYVGRIINDNQVVWTTRHQIHEQAMSLGTSLVEIGLKPGDRLGVYCENRIESVIFLEAAQIYGFNIVFAFDSSLEAYGSFIFSDSETSILYVSPLKSRNLNHIFKGGLPHLHTLILNEHIDQSYKIKIPKNVKQVLLEPLLHKTEYILPPLIVPEDICTICYSSGTVGAPKGVMLSHHVMLYAIYTITASVNAREWIIHVSFLPLAHILERITVGVIMFSGGRIVFARNNFGTAFEDMKIVHATAGPNIPFVLQKLHTTIKEKSCQNKFSQFALKTALSIQSFTRKLGFRSRIADSLVFDPIKKALGGCLEWFVVAGDTFSANVHQELSDILDIDLITIYGLSECGGPASISDRYDIVPGTVGCVAPYVNISISQNQDIYLNGNTMFSGYWNNPSITSKSYKGGMFSTGDKGYVDPHGYLIVTGRSSDIFEYEPGVQLALPYLSFAYQKSRYVNQIFIYPYAKRKCLLAIIVPKKSIVEYAMSATINDDETLEKLSREQRYTEWARKYLRSYARYEKLPSVAYLAAIRHVGKQFSIEDGLLTQTGKQRRKEFIKKFESDIEDMKKEVDERRERKKLTDDMLEYDDEKDEDV
ncbi:long-chain-fatty-acid--CoA ligase 5 isoform X2 [Histomonas meleagridis]|uniref:long-chain-fatty-acid--CoA ligase 5 isoform X2 n=1 Tax=Histomonas meleagridis TaxID=135588 RepID=UPI00355A94C0|nr:long-chain-fatty-acid--CoA ligase 5 isoform X2 [Histomonas meleagridis]KAH0799279.1 long-chain-fatty-acid--CoA ligase 5 isoform X2 [Histomonas meleagridis]